MANHKSALKRARQNEVRKERNRAGKSAMRSDVKKLESALESGGNAAELLSETIASISTAAAKGYIPKNRASRTIGRLSRRVHKASS